MRQVQPHPAWPCPHKAPCGAEVPGADGPVRRQSVGEILTAAHLCPSLRSVLGFLAGPPGQACLEHPAEHVTASRRCLHLARHSGGDGCPSLGLSLQVWGFTPEVYSAGRRVDYFYITKCSTQRGSHS